MLEYVLIILIFGVFYLLVVPVVSIWFTGRALFHRNAGGDDRDRDMDMVKVSSDWSNSLALSSDWSFSPILSFDWSVSLAMSSDLSVSLILISDWSSRSSNCLSTSARPCLSLSSAVSSSHLMEAPG